MRDWILGSNGKWVTMGVPSDGSYGIPEDYIYGVPVTTANGEYTRVRDLPIDDFSREKMNATLKELEEERAGVSAALLERTRPLRTRRPQARTVRRRDGRCRRCRRACTTPAASASSARRSRCRPSAARCSTSPAIARTARPIGGERAHAALMAGLIGGADNRFSRVGARVHDVHHPAWQAEVDVLLDGAGDRIAFLTLPKAERAADVERFLAHVADRAAQLGLKRAIPVSVLIETPGRRARRLGHRRAARHRLARLRAHGFRQRASRRDPARRHGVARAVRSSARASARSARSRRPPSPTASCPRTTSRARSTIRRRAFADARRARDEFGYLRMWSIHPSQIDPIVDAMRPAAPEVEKAQAILHAAQDAEWGPLRIDGELHDRASYRHAWTHAAARARRGRTARPRAAAYFEPAGRRRDASVARNDSRIHLS